MSVKSDRWILKMCRENGMIKPFEANNVVEYTLQPKGGSTEVTWAMQGQTPFLGKVVHVLLDMDKMVGADFEAGLTKLKALAER